MQTLVLEAPESLKLADVPEPSSPGSGEVLVRVHRVGVCGTDLHAYRGRQPFFEYPRILGHELGVEVVGIGANVTNVQVGDLCAVEPYMNCGRCIACRRGKTNCCTSMEVLGVHRDGGMRPFIVVPATKLYPSSKLDVEQLALIETLAIGAHAVARSGIESGENALIIGAGPIGFATLQSVQLAGANPILLDIQPSRLEFAQRVFGLETAFDARETTPESLEAQLGDLPTCVFDCTGNPQSMNNSFNYVAAGGNLVFVGFHQGEVTFVNTLFHRREMTVFASRNALPSDFSRLIALAESGKLDTSPWITHRAALEEVPAQFPIWLSPESGALKAMITL